MGMKIAAVAFCLAAGACSATVPPPATPSPETHFTPVDAPAATLAPTPGAPPPVISVAPTTSTPQPPTAEELLLKALRAAGDDPSPYAVDTAKDACNRLSDAGDLDQRARYLIDQFPFDRIGLYITYLCPGQADALKRSANGFSDGNYEVKATGDSDAGGLLVVRPGTYRTEPGTQDCYWERSTAGGKTLANSFVSNAPAGVTVTIRPTDGGFKSERCGVWLSVQ